MKTTKLVLLAAIMACASLGFSQSETKASQALPDPGDPQISVEISLRNALHSRALVWAMHQQLDTRFLLVEKPIYTVVVKLGDVAYYISGTYKEWNRFFHDTKP